MTQAISSSLVVSFNAKGLPPSTRLYVYVNDINMTSFVAPKDGKFGDQLSSNEIGDASGQIYLLSNQLVGIPAGKVSIKICDSDESPAFATFVAETIGYAKAIGENLSQDQGGTISTRPAIPIPSDNILNTVTGKSSYNSIIANNSKLYPLAQSFSVDASIYPQGMFITSISLYFITKDATESVQLHLRKVINGVPSTTDIIPNSIVFLPSSSINVPGSPSQGLGTATKFTFTTPIFLIPGEYAFCIISNSDEYSLYSGKINELILNSSVASNKQPNVGKLFKPQNTTDWVGDNTENLCFSIKKAKFETGSKTFNMRSKNVANVSFDKVNLSTNEIVFGENNTIDYKIKTKNIDGTADIFRDIIPGSTLVFNNGRKTANVASDVDLQVTFLNKDTNLSPVLDRQQTGIYTFKHGVSPYSTATSNTEIYSGNSLSRSRYISKMVTLAEEFEFNGIEVSLDVNRKTGTDVEVWTRVLGKSDNINTVPNSDIDTRPWKKLPLVSNGGIKNYIGTSDTLYVTEKYKVLETDSANLSYSADISGTVTSFTSFNRYQVKVVFYSDNYTYQPKIKNLIATAVL